MRRLLLSAIALLTGACAPSEAADRTANQVDPYPPPRVVMIGPDKPDEGITPAEGSAAAARIIAEGGTALQPLGAPTPPLQAPKQPTAREAFAKDCADHDVRFSALKSSYRLEIGGSKVRIERSVWQQMSGEDQSQLIWLTAFQASCAAGRRMMVDVKIVDFQQQPIRRQRASTELTCHGDMVGGPSDAPWYLC